MSRFMSQRMSRVWFSLWHSPSSRRVWLTNQTRAAVLAGASIHGPKIRRRIPSTTYHPGLGQVAGPSVSAQPIESVAPGLMQTLALHGVDAAKSAGAQYADVRMTRSVYHSYCMVPYLEEDTEEIGIGIRVLVNGYWGFAASPVWDTEEVARLARMAVAIATANAKGPARPVELGTVPAVTGTWTTPVKIDPFTVSIEEKLDYMSYWRGSGLQLGVDYQFSGYGSLCAFFRQERVLATTAGTLVTQTIVQSGGGHALIQGSVGGYVGGTSFSINDIGWAGKGWDLFLDANIPAQIPQRMEEALKRKQAPTKGATVGRYTLVCDGTTMAQLLGQTLGVATQLDRALGYEANAGGTSFLNDPLTMAGTFAVGSPLVNITSNRLTPTQLATVAWDDEGVVPAETSLIKNGVVVDFQTTRESANWLTPYYQRHGQPVRSQGNAGAQDALTITMQHMPNLNLTPNASAVGVEELIANVQDGIVIEQGLISNVDFQARNGLLSGQMTEIRNGRLGKVLTGGAVLFNTLELWKNISAVGGRDTQATVGMSRYNVLIGGDAKGQPQQSTDYSVSAPAATILSQTIIDPTKKA